jgi:hypothetical protein
LKSIRDLHYWVKDRFVQGTSNIAWLIVTTSVVDCSARTKTSIKVALGSAKTEIEGAPNLVALATHGRRSLRGQVGRNVSRQAYPGFHRALGFRLLPRQKEQFSPARDEEESRERKEGISYAKRKKICAN